MLPLPAEEEVAVEEEVEKTRPLFIKMPIRNGVRTYFIAPARRGRFQGTRPKLNVPHQSILDGDHKKCQELEGNKLKPG